MQNLVKRRWDFYAAQFDLYSYGDYINVDLQKCISTKLWFCSFSWSVFHLYTLYGVHEWFQKEEGVWRWTQTVTTVKSDGIRYECSQLFFLLCRETSSITGKATWWCFMWCVLHLRVTTWAVPVIVRDMNFHTICQSKGLIIKFNHVVPTDTIRAESIWTLTENSIKQVFDFRKLC